MADALESVVADTLALCAIAAPTGDEDDRARTIDERLTAAGATCERDEAGNVLARFGPRDGAASIVAAHLDTVFPHDTPLEPRRADGLLHGPGIGDDCLGLAALLHLARRLATGPPPEHPIVLAATVGEEGLGNLRGARALLDAQPCDAFVAIEGHGRDTLQVSGIGSARVRARFTAPGGHSWGDRGAPSAVHALLAAGARAIRAAGDAHINLGVVRGGTSVNTIAAEAVCEIDLRDADDAGLDATYARVERALRDANAALGRGVPAVCVGLTHGANAHRPDEQIELEPLAAGLAALDVLVEQLGRGLRPTR